MSNSATFYQTISQYYEVIFPLNPKAVEFTKSHLKEGDRVLDVGCATGAFSCAIAQSCKEVTAFDLNAEMVALAQQKQCAKVNFRIADMLAITKDYPLQHHDVVTCFGNTLVHLLTEELQLSFLRQVHDVLKKDGVFLLQILNYAHVLNNKITALPLIDNEQVSFVRTYELENGKSVFNFHTSLKVKNENGNIINTTLLFALRPEKLQALLEKAGFSRIEMYSSFDEATLSNEKLLLVVTASKE